MATEDSAVPQQRRRREQIRPEHLIALRKILVDETEYRTELLKHYRQQENSELNKHLRISTEKSRNLSRRISILEKKSRDAKTKIKMIDEYTSGEWIDGIGGSFKKELVECHILKLVEVEEVVTEVAED